MWTANGQLQLTFDPIHKVQVDQDVVVLLLQPVFDADDTQDVRTFAVQCLQNSQHTHKFLLTTAIITT